MWLLLRGFCYFIVGKWCFSVWEIQQFCWAKHTINFSFWYFVGFWNSFKKSTMIVTKQEAGDKPTAMNGFAKRVSSSPVSDKVSPQEEKSPLFPFPGKNNKFIQDVSLRKTTWNSLETGMWKTPKTRGSYHLHGKTRNSGCKIKWFAPFCLNWEVSEKIYMLCF